MTRRRWYLALAVVVLGAAAAAALGSPGAVATKSLKVQSVTERGAALGVNNFPEAPAEAVALRATREFADDPANDARDGVFRWDDASRTLAISIAAASASEAESVADQLGTDLSKQIETLVAGDISAAFAVADAQVHQLEDSIAKIEETINGLDVADPTRAVLLASAADLRAEAALGANRRQAISSLQTAIPTLVEAGDTRVRETSPGITTYVAGAMIGGALWALGACIWVLADRRVRSRLHIERAARGVRVIGLVTKDNARRGQLDSAVAASARSFVADHEVRKLIVFGVPRHSESVDTFAAALRSALEVEIESSTRPASDSVAASEGNDVGYIAVTRWGRTTEGALSSSVADVHSVGTLPLAIVLVDVPKRERVWAGALPADLVVESEAI